MQKWIELPAKPCDLLAWDHELKAAEKAIAEGYTIVWKFAAGLEHPFYPLEDELHFQSLSLALKQFSETVWPKFQDKTEAICLYRGTADFQDLFSWTERQQKLFKQWLEEELVLDDLLARRLFAAEAFAIYFQMLSHRLPDEAEVQLLFSLDSFTSASDALQVISKERFEHFQVAIRGMDIPFEGLWWDEKGVRRQEIDASVGIVFPSTVQSCVKRSFDNVLEKSKQEPVKIIFEGFVSEDWEGIDQLIVVQGSLSAQGERKIKGFCAAGGEVIYVD